MNHLDPKRLSFVIYLVLRIHQFQKYHLLSLITFRQKSQPPKIFKNECHFNSHRNNFLYIATKFPSIFQKHGHDRIVGGFEPNKALPDQLSLATPLWDGIKSEAHFCGGTLITSSYAISGQFFYLFTYFCDVLS